MAWRFEENRDTKFVLKGLPYIVVYLLNFDDIAFLERVKKTLFDELDKPWRAY